LSQMLWNKCSQNHSLSSGSLKIDAT
jgi:hypothetical protein